MDDYFSIFPFSSLTKEERKQFNSICSGQIEHYRKGETITDDVSGKGRLFVVLEGGVQSSVLSPSGKELLVRQIKGPALIAANLLFFSGQPAMNNRDFEELHHRISIKGISDITTISFSRKNFRKAMGVIPSLLDSFLSFQAMRFSEITRQLYYLSISTIKKKISLYLLDLYALNGRKSKTVKLPMSITETAAMFSVERPSLSNVLSELEKDGFIRKNSPRSIELINSEGLEELLFM